MSRVLLFACGMIRTEKMPGWPLCCIEEPTACNCVHDIVIHQKMIQHDSYSRIKGFAQRRMRGAVFASVLFVVGVMIGSHCYLLALEAQGNPLGALLREFKPAVLFASGRGMVYSDTLDLPALDAFLAGETAFFRADFLPKEIAGMHLLANPDNTFPLTHWLLMYSVGWCWRLFGISHESLRFLCGFLYGLSAVALYFLFRLGMGRVISAFGVVVVLLLPPFMAIAPMARDFSKAPFILCFLALSGNLLKKRASPEVFLRYGAALGLSLIHI